MLRHVALSHFCSLELLEQIFLWTLISSSLSSVLPSLALAATRPSMIQVGSHLLAFSLSLCFSHFCLFHSRRCRWPSLWRRCKDCGLYSFGPWNRSMRPTDSFIQELLNVDGEQSPGRLSRSGLAVVYTPLNFVSSLELNFCGYARTCHASRGRGKRVRRRKKQGRGTPGKGQDTRP